MMTEGLPVLSAARVVPPPRDGRSPHARKQVVVRRLRADLLTAAATVAEPELLADPHWTKVTTLILIYAQSQFEYTDPAPV